MEFLLLVIAMFVVVVDVHDANIVIMIITLIIIFTETISIIKPASLTYNPFPAYLVN